ncbi:MAG: peptidoglycan DD-metalloendopeptidase family protein [Candidatus Kerfeldbacteria bacterium]|nr:peptidoglycan DD-metalloendopeptidase family protein [Candidatus Kerfeldbacteria bacterium]
MQDLPHTRPSIQFHIQRTFWRFLGSLLKGIRLLTALLILAGNVLRSPILWVLRLVFLLVFVNAYKIVYLPAKIRLGAIWRPAKNKILFPLATRYVVHILLIALTTIVTTSSIKARENRYDESFRPLLLGGLLQENENDEVVETAASVFAPSDYFDGIGGVSPLDMTPGIELADVATTQDSSSLLKPALAATTESARPRDDVMYHVVEGGETVSTIAEQYNISVNTILWENRLGARDLIQPGQKLTILPSSGVSHRVASGETVASIAKKYEANEADIVEYNKLADASAIAADQVLLIPGGRVPPPPAPIAPTTRLAVDTGGTAPPSITAPRGGGLLWPTPSHKINQYFTYRHSGVDIDGEYTSPIYAAESGRVEFVGWGGGYGLHVIVNHGNGMKTLYAHASKTFVKAGQNVDKGQTLAMQGSTGWSTGVHLHFEVFINGRKTNPFSYL